MTDNRMEKLNEIMEQNAETIANFEEPAQVQAFLSSQGVALSDSEMKELAAVMADDSTGELSEDELDSVTGGAGVALSAAYAAIMAMAKTGALRPRFRRRSRR